MPTTGHSSTCYDVPVGASIGLIAGMLLFVNILGVNNNFSALSQIAIAQTSPSSTSQFLIRNVQFYSSLDKAGDPVQITIGPTTADGNCEICSFIKYIPGPTGKAGVAYRSAQTLDLTSAKRIVFFAKGELGGENVAFVAAGKPSNIPPASPSIFSNLKFGVLTKNITLTNDWARYQLSLNGSELTGVTNPFGFIVSKVRSQAASSSNSPHAAMTDANANHIAFFLKGVTLDNNPAINPVPKLQLSTTNITATPTKAATLTNSLNATATTPTNTTNGKTTPNTTATLTSLNATATTPTPTKAATSSNLKSGTNPTTSSIHSATTNIITKPTQGNASLASGSQQPWHQWNKSANSITTQSPFTNTTNAKVVPMSNTPTIPETFNPSSPTTESSSNTSVLQKQQQPQVILVPSQPQTAPSLSTTNSGQPSHTWQNPPIGLSQKQQQPQVIILPAQHQNQSSLANTALQHPYQSQAPYPYPYQSQAPYPYPYQSQAPYPYQYSLTNQPPIANAGISQTVTEGTTIALDGRGSYTPIIGNGNIAAYQWSQLPIGIPVTLRGANAATPTFTTPAVPVDTSLAFNLRVMDNHGTVSTNPAVVYVMIKHKPNNGPITRGNNADTGNHGLLGQVLTPNDIFGATSQSNSPPSLIVSPNTLNAFPSRVR
jgi:K319-like protein